MSHSGGKPHAVGDKGQRYEVTFYDPAENRRRALGWSDSIEGALAMANAVEVHPSWQFPWVTDRSPGAHK